MGVLLVTRLYVINLQGRVRHTLEHIHTHMNESQWRVKCSVTTALSWGHICDISVNFQYSNV